MAEGKRDFLGGALKDRQKIADHHPPMDAAGLDTGVDRGDHGAIRVSHRNRNRTQTELERRYRRTTARDSPVMRVASVTDSEASPFHYDGIVTGIPAADRTNEIIYYLWTLDEDVFAESPDVFAQHARRTA